MPGTADPDENGDTYVDTELEQVDGVYDFVPSDTASLDSLYEMLQGFNEDSVNIYEGLDTLPPVVSRGRIDAADDGAAHGDAAPVDRAAGSGFGRGDNVAIEGVDFGAPTTETPTTEPAATEPPAAGKVGPVEDGAVEIKDAEISDVELLGIEVTEHNLEALQEQTSHEQGDRTAPADAPSADTTATSSVPTDADPTDADPTAADAVATGWPATMGSEREPETTLENPVDHAANHAARAAQQANAPASAITSPAAEQSSAGQTTADHEETRAITPRPKRRKRAAVPSWDEIMFGGPGRTDI